MAGPDDMKPKRLQTVPPPLNSPEGRALREQREAEAAAKAAELPAWRRFFRAAVPWLFLVFLGMVLMQVALAGAGLLGDDRTWETSEDGAVYVGGRVSAQSAEYLSAHATFVRGLELACVLLVLAGFLGADKEAGGVGIALLLLIGLQYALVNAGGIARSFHVLNALIIFTLALTMTLSRIPWKPKLLDHVVD